MVYIQSHGPRRKIDRHHYFVEVGYGYIDGQICEGNTVTFNDRTENKIDVFHAKLRHYDNSVERDMSKRRTASFKDIYANGNPGKLEDTSFDADRLYDSKPAV